MTHNYREYLAQYIFASFGLLVVYFLFANTNHSYVAITALVTFGVVQLFHVVAVLAGLRKIFK